MIRFAKAIGSNTDFQTAQAFIFPKVASEVQDPNRLYMGVIILGEGEDVFSKVRQASGSLEEKFFETDVSPTQKISEIIPFLKETLKDVENLEILASVWKEGILYVQSTGTPKAYLQRGEKILNLLKNSSPQELVSGYLKPGDKLLLVGSKPPSEPEEEPQNFSEVQIQELIDSSIENFEEDLASFMQSTQNLNPTSAILMNNNVDSEKTSIPGEIPEIQQQYPQLKPSFNFKKLPNFKKILPIFLVLLRKVKPLLPRGRKAILVSVILLIAAFLVARNLYNVQKQNSQRNAQVTQLLTAAKSKFDEAKSLKDADTQKAQEALMQSSQNLEEALKIDPKNSKAQTFQKDLQSGKEAILKIYNITDWPVFLSLDLIKQNFKTSRLSFSLGKLLLLDESDKSLVAIDIKNKTNQILAGKLQLGEAQFASLNGTNAFAFSPDKGITMIDIKAKKPQVIVTPDTSWGNISDIVAFSSNVYLLDNVKSAIYKYTPTSSGFSNKMDYLREDQKAEFGLAKALRIDFSVWVLKPGPEIHKFTGGYEDSFSPSGLDKPIKEVKSFFVSLDPDQNYFLDPENSRLLVLDKTGKYLSQYVGEKFATATDFIVDFENKKIYLLEGGKIYQLNLR